MCVFVKYVCVVWVCVLEYMCVCVWCQFSCLINTKKTQGGKPLCVCVCVCVVCVYCDGLIDCKLCLS